MRIAIDMQGAQTDSRFRGIGRYTLSLAQAMARNRGEHDIVLVLNGLFTETIEPIRAAFNGLLPQSSIHVWSASGAVRMVDPANSWRHTAAEYIRETFIASLRPDAIHVSSLFEGYGDDAVTSVGRIGAQIPTVVTLYDLIPLLNAETYLKPNPDYERYYRSKLRAMQHASMWLSISESSANEGRKELGLPVDAVVNISAACDAVFRPLEITTDQRKRVLERLGITRPFVLYSGGADVRKNLPRLIRAYARLPAQVRNEYQLVVVGKISDAQASELLNTAGMAHLTEQELLLTSYVSDADLALLYNLCTAFVLPSFHEGFGLPALEAMSCGAATIGSYSTSIPEVIGRADALFDPYDEASISELLCRVLCDEVFRSGLVAHGLQHAKNFSWDLTARRAIAAFETLSVQTVREVNPNAEMQFSDQLVKHIAAVVPSNISKRELLSLAHAISQVDDMQPTASSVRTPTKRIFIDCSATQASSLKTGIERVVRNIAAHAHLAGQSAGVSCQLVRLTSGGYVIASTHDFNQRLHMRARTIASKVFVGTMRSLSRFAPNCMHRYLVGTRHEPSLVRLVFTILSPIICMLHWFSNGRFGRASGSAVTFQRGDILLLADSVWNYTPWSAVQAAKADGAFVATLVYDIIPVTHPQYFASASREKFGAALAGLVRHCDAFVSISAFTQSQLSKHIQTVLGPDRTEIPGYARIALGADLDLLDSGGKIRAHVREIFSNRSRVYLMVGTLEPRKNHSYLLQSFQKIWETGAKVSLLIVGRVGWMSEALLSKIESHALFGECLFFVDDATDTELDYCYNQAHAVLQTSVVEGFGLPLIEALSRGRPVFASDIPVFREVGGEYPVYFDLSCPDALCDALLDFESSGIFRGGNPREFNWPTWSQSTAELISKVLALHAANAAPRQP